MCGVAGCYQQADGRELTDVMTDRIAHRGPDLSLDISLVPEICHVSELSIVV